MTPRPSTRSSLPRRIHLPRTIGLGLGGIAVGAALRQHGAASAWVWSALAFDGLLWPHLALWLALRSPRPSEAERRNLLIDSAWGGFWLPAMGFNVLPSVLIATMLAMNNLAVGGQRLFARGLLALAAGAGLGALLLGSALEPAATLPTILACLPFLVAYPLTIGLATYRLSRQLSRQKQAIERSERLHRTTLDAMDAGIVLYDAGDRLVLCNDDFRKLYGPIAPLLQPGMRFEELLRHAVQAGLVPEAAGREEAWIRERLAEHAAPHAPMQRELPGGRWRRIIEQRLPDGSLLAFSTDVTELVQRERELEQMVAQRDSLAEALGQANERLEALSETDALTGIANRRQFDRRLREECARARRHRWPLALLMVDVDHFKRYNDLHGHPAGDECLRRVAAVLHGCAQRTGDLAARYGGEEFTLLLPHTTLREARLIAERCLAAVDEAAIVHGDSPVGPHVTLSIGVAVQRGPAATMPGPDDLLADADHALYLAKARGRHRVAGLDDEATAPPQLARG
ncbi:sensor domain-containing diguanylate cyclase [Ideonella sp.]|uniref:sensor domain-containing diguanylate cyclase n=1 Tax=Ideonella sp. TaxID=1929293 RepID=UPI002B49D36F|nr:diguanylate cyclase [Ideonella sp.]HJV71348.1 diguanylate cyclase [Ideonella sp.]